MHVIDHAHVLADGLNQVALHDLHMVDVVQETDCGRVHAVHNGPTVCSMIQEVADVVNKGVQGLNRQLDPLVLRHRRQGLEVVDDAVGLLLRRDALDFVANGNDKHLRVELPGDRCCFFHRPHHLAGRILLDHYHARWPQKAGHTDARPVACPFHSCDVLVPHAPELDRGEAQLRCLRRPLVKVHLGEQHLDADAYLRHRLAPPMSGSKEGASYTTHSCPFQAAPAPCCMERGGLSGLRATCQYP